MKPGVQDARASGEDSRWSNNISHLKRMATCLRCRSESRVTPRGYIYLRLASGMQLVDLECQVLLKRARRRCPNWPQGTFVSNTLTARVY